MTTHDDKNSPWGGRDGPKRPGHIPQAPRAATPPRSRGYSGRWANIRRMALVAFGLVLLIWGLSLAFPGADVMGPNLIAPSLILVFLGSSWLVAHRVSPRQIIRNIGIWVAIFVVLSGVYLYGGDFGGRFMAAVDPAAPKQVGQDLVVRRSRDGHFWLRATLNGVPLKMMVDTGASHIVLSRQDAEDIGLDVDSLDFSLRANTANGAVPFARARLRSFRLGENILYDQPITVNRAEMPGSLLGMSALSQFSSVEFRGNELILRP